METAKKYGMVIQSPTEVMSFESFDDADVYFLKNLMEKKLHFILFLSDKNEDIHSKSATFLFCFVIAIYSENKFCA